MRMVLKLGHSPDADDAFMFYAMTNGKVETKPFQTGSVWSWIWIVTVKPTYSFSIN